MAKKSSSPKPTSARVTVDKDSSVSARKIENGFIISESGTTGKGKNKDYYHKEWFSKNNPIKFSGMNGSGGNGGRTTFGRKK